MVVVGWVVVMLTTVMLFDLLCDAPCAPKNGEAAPKKHLVKDDGRRRRRRRWMCWRWRWRRRRERRWIKGTGTDMKFKTLEEQK